MPTWCPPCACICFVLHIDLLQLQELPVQVLRLQGHSEERTRTRPLPPPKKPDLNLRRMVCWIRASVSLSTLAVASSATSTRGCRQRAGSRQQDRNIAAEPSPIPIASKVPPMPVHAARHCDIRGLPLTPTTQPASCQQPTLPSSLDQVLTCSPPTPHPRPTPHSNPPPTCRSSARATHSSWRCPTEKFSPPSATRPYRPSGRADTASFRDVSPNAPQISASLCVEYGSRFDRTVPEKRTGSWAAECRTDRLE